MVNRKNNMKQYSPSNNDRMAKNTRIYGGQSPRNAGFDSKKTLHQTNASLRTNDD